MVNHSERIRVSASNSPGTTNIMSFTKNCRLQFVIFGGFSVVIFLLFSLPLDLFHGHARLPVEPNKRFVIPISSVRSVRRLSDVAAFSKPAPQAEGLPGHSSVTGDTESNDLIQPPPNPVPFTRGTFSVNKKFIQAELDNYTPPTNTDLEFVLSKEKGFDEKPPLDFLPDWKNPCWLGNTKVGGTRLKCLPYFYILGFPKCATTDLWQRMKLHPQIEEKVPKETHWWSRLRYDGTAKSMGRYYAGELFGKHMMENQNRSSKTWILGDGSPSYVYEAHNEIRYKMINEKGYMHLDPPMPKVLVGHLIKKYTPKAKFVLMVRNPTNRIFSHHVYFGTKEYKRDYTFRRSPRKLHYLVIRMINLYKQCFSEKPVRQCMYDPTLYRECEESKVRLDRSMYAVYINDWLKIFPREQFFFIKLKDYADDNKRREILRNLFKFLDLSPVNGPLLERMVTQIRASAKNKDPKLKSMLNETRDLLNKFFKPFNEVLADILGDKKYLFEDETS